MSVEMENGSERKAAAVRSRTGFWVVITAMLFSLGGCSADEIVCPQWLPVLSIDVWDAATGAAAARGATGRIQSGSYAALLYEERPPHLLVAAIGPAGMYNVLIQKAGYRDWVQDVRVRGGKCGASSIHLRADLQSAS